MADSITTILTSGVASVAASATLVFIARNWISERIKGSIQHEYDQKIETHKANLKRDYDVQVERLRAQFQIDAIRYSKIFTHTAETIEAVYQRLLPFLEAAEDYVELMEPADSVRMRSDSKQSELQQTADEFYDYYKKHKIYIPKDTRAVINVFTGKVISLVGTWATIQKAEKAQIKNQESVSLMYLKYETLTKEIPPLLAKLEDDFQRLLGITVDGERR